MSLTSSTNPYINNWMQLYFYICPINIIYDILIIKIWMKNQQQIVCLIILEWTEYHSSFIASWRDNNLRSSSVVLNWTSTMEFCIFIKVLNSRPEAMKRYNEAKPNLAFLLSYDFCFEKIGHTINHHIFLKMESDELCGSLLANVTSWAKNYV